MIDASSSVPRDRRSSTNRWWPLRSERSPDLKKLEGLIGVRRCETERLLATTDDAVLKDRAVVLLDSFDPATATNKEEELCYAHIEKLDELNPLLGDVHRTFAVLESELRRPAREKPVALGEVVATGEMERLRAKYRKEGKVSPNDLAWVRNCLTRLVRERNDRSRHDRVTEVLKRRMVKRFFFPLLLLLTAGFAVTCVLAHQDGAFWRRLLFAAAAGALGGMLSGATKLRDMFAMDDVRRFSQWIWLQPVFGAAAGLVVFLAYVKVHRSKDWPGEGLAGFAGGFSEPFFLRTVERLTGSESEPDSSRPARAP
jgi:hypothetical protein